MNQPESIRITPNQPESTRMNQNQPESALHHTHDPICFPIKPYTDISTASFV